MLELLGNLSSTRMRHSNKMQNYDQKSPEVLVCKGDISLAGKSIIKKLKLLASKSPKKRARFCAHQNNQDSIHEMLIVLKEGTYIQPHAHQGKTESFQVIEGQAEILIFDDKGAIKKRIVISGEDPVHPFYYRLNTNYFHTVVVKSEYFTFFETTNGPWNPNQSIYAHWAPSEDAPDDIVTKYLYSLIEDTF